MHQRTETRMCIFFYARQASFGHLGIISDPLIVSKFHNETHDPKGQENKIYTIVKGRDTFYNRHTVPVTSRSEVKYVIKCLLHIEIYIGLPEQITIRLHGCPNL